MKLINASCTCSIWKKSNGRTVTPSGQIYLNYGTVECWREIENLYVTGLENFKPNTMDINRLLVDEIDYELLVRGVSCSGTVADKRKLLRSRSNLDKITKTSSSNVTLNFVDELRVCDDKLGYIETELPTFVTGLSDNDFVQD
ncbi:hypothetical protein FQA39_LY16509 [Lamprigera yunnana]|nr:hypothetical protein FQA39_LY16509 [Lamprigera yunnana]